MRNYSYIFVQNLIILLFVVLTCTAFLKGDATNLPLAGVVFWLALLGLLGSLNDKVSEDKNYRMVRIFNWLTVLVGSVIPATLAGFFVGGWLIGLVSGGLTLMLNLAIYLYTTNFVKLNKKR